MFENLTAAASKLIPGNIDSYVTGSGEHSQLRRDLKDEGHT
ncbi:conserved hypothetical protein [Xenorhabdus bovienii str. puntauvense]|uniref:Uncharacterized protein n=2 Tax=Xenorhabdus bovienii TaxID=40576 RepID=A0A0B6X5J5_XENBV|nr:conserved hypothetical protein [Xenorhabdus bovienii str. puntauvense]CDM88411.1 conserved protein of unknown function [Xenorhabdus bovienii]